MKKTLTRILFLWITISLIGVYAWKHYTMWDITFEGIEIPRPEFIHLFSDYRVIMDTDEYGYERCIIQFFDEDIRYEGYYNYTVDGLWEIKDFESYRGKVPETPEDFAREGITIKLFRGRTGGIYFNCAFLTDGAKARYEEEGRGDREDGKAYKVEIRITTAKAY